MKTIIIVVTIVLVATLGVGVFSGSVMKYVDTFKTEEAVTSDVIKIHNKDYGIDDSIKTWNDFVDSKYNVDGFFVTNEDDYIHVNDDGIVLSDFVGNKVNKNYEIVRDKYLNVYNYTYADPSFSNIMFWIDGDGYTAKSGITWGEWIEEYPDKYQIGSNFHADKTDEISLLPDGIDFICRVENDYLGDDPIVIYTPVKVTDEIIDGCDYSLYPPYGA